MNLPDSQPHPSTIIRALDRTAESMTSLGDLALALMMVLIVADVVARFAFNYVIDAGAEVVAHYLMVGISYFPLAQITREQKHLSATFFTDWMSPRGKAVLEGVVALMLGTFMLLLTWRTAVSAFDATKIGEMLQASRTNLPLWPSRWILPIGSGVMAVYAFVIAGWKFSGRLGANESSETPTE